jgi:HSP20 family protein
MANLIRRENREAARPRTSGLFLDPFRMMDEMLRWDPFRSQLQLNEAWGTGMTEFVPSFEVKETKDEYLIKADVPGVEEKDVEISVTGNVIQVSGRREQEKKEEGERFYAMERSYGQFTRAFSLPEGADAERVSAELKDGVLAVHIPKKPEVQPKRINLGQGGQRENGGGQKKIEPQIKS